MNSAKTSYTAVYTLWGFKPKGATEVYVARLDQIAGSSLTTTADSFAAGGFVITAATTNTAGYTLWGFKPQ